MKIIRNRFIPFKGFSAINICGIIFMRRECEMSYTMLRHESIHTAQMRELGYIFFYIFYLVEWLWNLVKTRNSIDAYYSISFEKEAYQNEYKASYLKHRKHFAQWRRNIINK